MFCYGGCGVGAGGDDAAQIAVSIKYTMLLVHRLHNQLHSSYEIEQHPAPLTSLLLKLVPFLASINIFPSSVVTS